MIEVIYVTKSHKFKKNLKITAININSITYWFIIIYSYFIFIFFPSNILFYLSLHLLSLFALINFVSSFSYFIHLFELFLFCFFYNIMYIIYHLFVYFYLLASVGNAISTNNICTFKTSGKFFSLVYLQNPNHYVIDDDDNEILYFDFCAPFLPA